MRRRRDTRGRELVARGMLRLLVLRRIPPRRRRARRRRVAPVPSSSSSSISTAFVPSVPPSSVPALVLAGISVHLASSRGWRGRRWRLEMRNGEREKRQENLACRGARGCGCGVHLRGRWEVGGARGAGEITCGAYTACAGCESGRKLGSLGKSSGGMALGLGALTRPEELRGGGRREGYAPREKVGVVGVDENAGIREGTEEWGGNGKTAAANGALNRAYLHLSRL